MVDQQRRKSDGKEGKSPTEKSWPTVARQNEKRADMLSQTTRGAAVFSACGSLLDCNEAYRAVHDLPIELIAPGTSLSDILHFQVESGNCPDSDPEHYVAGFMNMTRKGEVQTRIEVMPNGHVISVGHLPIDGGGWITTLDDISDLYAIKEEMEHSSYYDRRTSLPNERLLMNCLDDAFAEQWEEESFALIAVDFTRFDPQMQQVSEDNHAALMAHVADRLTHTIRRDDVPAKLEGARFAIVQAGVTNAGDAEALARRLATVLAMPYTIGEQTLMPNFHMGIALPEHQDLAEEELLDQAFEAAKQARSISRKRYAFYVESNQAMSA